VGHNIVTRDGVLTKSALIPISNEKRTSPSFTHDIWLTENFITFTDGSLRNNGKSLMEGKRFFEWDLEHNMRY
jgi:hypothetical protein